MTCLKEIRESLGLSQEELASLIRNVSAITIRYAEEGRTIPYRMVKQILEAGRPTMTFQDLGVKVR